MVMLLTASVLAELPSIARTYASASGDAVRKVVLTVKVTNRSSEVSDPAVVTVNCKPAGRGSKEGNTLRDPLELGKVIGPMQPGETKVIELATPYESSSKLRQRSGAFRANNIDSTGERNVAFKALVKSALRR